MPAFFVSLKAAAGGGLPLKAAGGTGAAAARLGTVILPHRRWENVKK